jgi:folylpolyglutamate synthase/dihydropteroate synthase
VALSKDVVIRMLGDATSAIAAQKAAADAAEVSVAQYKRAQREYQLQQAAEKAASDARTQNLKKSSARRRPCSARRCCWRSASR